MTDMGSLPLLKICAAVLSSAAVVVAIPTLASAVPASAVPASAIQASAVPASAVTNVQPTISQAPQPVQGAAVPASRTDGAASVSTSIPAIAFQPEIISTDGRLRAAVLVNASQVAGVARLIRDGVPTDCSVAALPGVIAWLTCAFGSDTAGADGVSDPESTPVAGTTSYEVVVTLADGRTARHAVTVRP